jgi:tRNA dimethylallyltransferase
LLAGDVDGMKRHTRNYARRQLTWMRKLAGVQVIDVTDRAAVDVAEQILTAAA